MRVILSRKGFDGGYGGIPSPILNSQTPISFPIPYRKGQQKYSELYHSSGITYMDLIHGLRNKHTIYSDDGWEELTRETNCHLDPDLAPDVRDREKQWLPLFGQSDAALSHLESQDVGEGSLFLFFGWFKKAEDSGSGFRFVAGAKELHVIFGYLQVGEVINNPNDLKDWMRYHDHYQLVGDRDKKDALYVARPTLSFDESRPGAGVLPFDEKRVLTKTGFPRSRWSLPDYLRGVNLTYHSSQSWKENYFQSASRGQEFVFQENETVSEWAKQILS